MTDMTQKYSIGDWVVHLHYGTGQIKKTEGSFISIARLLCDLSARSMVKKLNTLEEQTLNSFTEQLNKEWSLCMEISIDAVQAQLHNILQETRN